MSNSILITRFSFNFEKSFFFISSIFFPFILFWWLPIWLAHHLYMRIVHDNWMYTSYSVNYVRDKRIDFQSSLFLSFELHLFACNLLFSSFSSSFNQQFWVPTKYRVLYKQIGNKQQNGKPKIETTQSKCDKNQINRRSCKLFHMRQNSISHINFYFYRVCVYA